AIDARVRFASAADRAAFAEELASTVATLVSRYHDENAEGGREHRLVLAVHPHVPPDQAASAGPPTDTDPQES
ncbi:ArsR family transcriptional regulator, partial [Microbispora sp. NPDC049125]